MAVDAALFVHENDLAAQGVEDAEKLTELAHEVRSYLEHHSWCEQVHDVWFADGFRYAAVFYAKIAPLGGADPEMFVIVGDIPPLYIDLDGCDSAQEALEIYVDLMLQLCDAYDRGESLEDLPPLQERLSWNVLEPDSELIDMLRGRMEFIRKHLIEGQEV